MVDISPMFYMFFYTLLAKLKLKYFGYFIGIYCIQINALDLLYTILCIT